MHKTFPSASFSPFSNICLQQSDNDNRVMDWSPVQGEYQHSQLLDTPGIGINASYVGLGNDFSSLIHV